MGLPDFAVTGWHGYLVPTGTPPEIVRRLNVEIAAALRTEDYSAWANSMGSEIGAGAPEQFGMLIQGELERWGGIVRTSGISLE